MVNISASHAGARGSIPRFGNRQSDIYFFGFPLHRLKVHSFARFFGGFVLTFLPLSLSEANPPGVFTPHATAPISNTRRVDKGASKYRKVKGS